MLKYKKMGQVIKVARKNFLPKTFFLHFCKNAYSLENQNTMFGSNLFLQIREQELDKNIFNSCNMPPFSICDIFEAF